MDRPTGRVPAESIMADSPELCAGCRIARDRHLRSRTDQLLFAGMLDDCRRSESLAIVAGLFLCRSLRVGNACSLESCLEINARMLLAPP